VDLDQYLAENPPHLSLLRLLYKDSSPSVIVDVGCCEGEDSLRYLRTFQQAMIYGIEPNPENINKINSLTELVQSERFSLSQAAVSNHVGTSTLHLSSGHPEDKPKTEDWDYGNKSSSLLKPASLMQRIVPWLKFERSIQVPTTTLDEFAKHHSIDHVDLLHMDIQGAELLALQGAVRILPKTGTIWVEVADQQIYQDQPSSDQITDFLAELGFLLVLRSVSDGLGDHLYANNNYFEIHPRYALR
jgi:FkbM family methyltransferase